MCYIHIYLYLRKAIVTSVFTLGNKLTKKKDCIDQCVIARVQCTSDYLVQGVQPN